MKDFIKVERTFDVDKFFVGHAYHIYSKTLKEGHTCLLKSKSENKLEFIYFDDGETIPYYIRLYPNDFIDDDYTITEAVFKVDIPEVKIISEWKTIKEAFATPGYFNNGDCYEIRTDSQIGPFQRTVKGFLSEYYPTKLMLRFVVHNVDSETKAAVLDIIPHDTTDDVKIRRLN